MGTGSLPQGYSGRGVTLTTPSSSAEVKEIMELYIYSPLSGFHGLFYGELFFTQNHFERMYVPTDTDTRTYLVCHSPLLLQHRPHYAHGPPLCVLRSLCHRHGSHFVPSLTSDIQSHIKAQTCRR